MHDVFGMPAPRTCNCGSGKERWLLRDARGIECGYVCEDCVDEKKAQYRPEIFDDCDYDPMGETIEPEEGEWF